MKRDTFNNLFGSEQPFGIEVNEYLFIPFITHGTKVYFKSRVPTREELETCLHIEMTNKTKWKPNSIELRVQKVNKAREARLVAQVTSVNKYGDPLSCEYDYPTSDIVLLHNICSSLFRL